MAKYLIEVDETVDKILKENANLKSLSVESVIKEILNRFTISAHTMQYEDELKEGYQQSGDINLDWANL